MYPFFDTNVLLDHHENIFKNPDIYFAVSSITLSELESIKTSYSKDEQIKYKARNLLRLLNDNQDKYTIVIYNETYEYIIKQHDLPVTNDTKILACAYNSKDSFFVTKDLACKALAAVMGVKVDDDYPLESEEDYTGFLEVEGDEDWLANLYTSIGKNDNVYNLYDNQYLIIKQNNEIIDMYKWHYDEYVQISFKAAKSVMFGNVKPKDYYQKAALDSLYSNKFTILRGPAGAGKSLLAMSFLFAQLENGKIDKIIIFANTVATRGAAKLGFLPGDREEKLLDSQIGNFLISKIGGREAVEELIDRGTLVLLPFADIRGYDTSDMNAGVYITESQNADIDMLKLAIQRIGEDCILILDGDDKTQVDLSSYSGMSNGLRRASEVFRGQDYYGEITLQKIYRSRIAERADLM